MKILNKLMAIAMVFALAGVGLMPAAMAQYQRNNRYNQRSYRNNDNYVRRLITRIETHTDRFSNLLPNALDRSRINGSQREDNVNQLVTDFEHATDQLKKQFERRESTGMDAQEVLQRGALINTFMRNHRLDYRTERAWTLVKTDLDRLANTYNVARNWDTITTPYAVTTPYMNADALITGTFRLNTTTGNNARTVAQNATRNLNYNERQRVYNNLVARLEAPEMIAIERRGNNIALASTRSPQVTFDVDGRERVETYPNGRASRVRATFNNERLTVMSNGDRVNDFTATFMPIENGRRLLVTRSLYAERLARPVMVQSYYDRTSDVAQLNIYNPNANLSATPTANGNFFVPNNTQLVAVLNNNLTTANARNNDRFTMTVRSPSEYDGAVIEGYLTGVNRSGRVTGRSGLTLNFDRIRLRNGSSYQFAGIVNSVRTAGNENVRVGTEGNVQEGDNRTTTTVERTAIGTAIGALIGAIAGGGSGAAIGAGVGAGTGAGSVYVQGRDDLQLMGGTEVTINATAPANFNTAIR